MKTKHVLVSLALSLSLLVVLGLVLIGASQAAPAAPQATTRYVAPGGVCGGASPCYATVQAAVDAAQPSDVIKIAAGAYTDVSGRPRADVESTGIVTQVVYLTKTVTLQGGYTTSNWTTPHPDVNVTTLDAQGKGRVLYVTPLKGVLGTGKITVTVQGLRLINGNADRLCGGPTWYCSDAGGGIYALSASIALSNVQINDNTACVWARASGCPGGGLYLVSGALTLANSTLSRNTATDSSGGGIHMDNSSVSITGSTLSENGGSDGGGVYLGGCTGEVSASTIYSNTAAHYGGGFYLASSPVTLNGNTITQNAATAWGGGIYADHSPATLRGNLIGRNKYTSHGGGVLLSYSNATLENNLIVENTTPSGGIGSGVAVLGSRVLMQHNTLARNSGGEGVYVGYQTGAPSEAILINNIVVSHTTGLAVNLYSEVRAEGTFWGGGAWANTNDTVSAGRLVTGTINVRGDPAFVNPGALDYHLGATSAAKDVAVYPTLESDLDGQVRPMGSGPDIGADEVQAPALLLSQSASGSTVQRNMEQSPSLGGTVNTGQAITYNLSITAAGSGGSNSVALTDTLPPEQRIVSASADRGSCATGGTWGGTVTCTLGALNLGDTAHVVVNAQTAGNLPGPEAAPVLMTNTVIIASSGGSNRSQLALTLQDCAARINSGTADYFNLQAAVDAAAPGDLVKVAGTCGGVTLRGDARPQRPNYYTVLPSIQRQVLYVDKPVVLRGGYTRANWILPDSVANPTTLNAGGLGRVAWISTTAPVSLEGLRFVGGNASGLLGKDMNGDETDYYYGAGGGIYVFTGSVTISNSVIYSNTASSWGRGFGGGLFQFDGAIRLVNSSVLSNTAFVQRNGLALQPGDGWGGGMMANGDLTLENVVLQGNGNTSTAGGGLYFLGQGLTMTGCTVRGNQADAGGGALLGGGPGLIQNSRFESNSSPASVSSPDCGFYECGSGGGLYVMGPFDVVGSRFLSNTSTLHGGGVMVDGSSSYFANNVIEGNAVSTTYYLAMGGGIYFSYSWSDTTLKNTLIRNNTAPMGAGVSIYSDGPTMFNTAIVDNRLSLAGGHGAGIYMDGNFLSPQLTHSTLSRNSGGDNTGVYIAGSGQPFFTNTLIYSHSIGLRTTGATPVMLLTLYDHNDTDTMGLVADFGPLKGDAKLAADGYHLQHGSAALEQGLETPVLDDIDGDKRPMPEGTFPDLGADEAPYDLEGSSTFVAQKSALLTRYFVRPNLHGDPYGSVLQDYFIRFFYGSANPNPPFIKAYTVTDQMPSQLTFNAESHQPAMTFKRAPDGTLNWTSSQPISKGQSARILVGGMYTAPVPGETLVNNAGLAVKFGDDSTLTRSLQAVNTIPVFQPLITFPQPGEICAKNPLTVTGLAQPNVTVEVYENGYKQGQSQADAKGLWSYAYVSARVGITDTVLAARACGGATCSPYAMVSLEHSRSFWCPQRSKWEGSFGGETYNYPFKDTSGRYSTSMWQSPGIWGMNHFTVTINFCHCPDPADDANYYIEVEADGKTYSSQKREGDNWQFIVNGAHNVTFRAVCGDPPHAVSDTGHVLIDPDGYVFDVTKGLSLTAGVSDTVQVTNTVAGVTVTAYVSMPEWGGWVPWPAQMYNNQKNPQVTGKNGYFAFFTPPGSYYLQADDIAGYQSWRSPVAQVITQIVHVNIPFTPLPATAGYTVTTTPRGQVMPAVITVPVGSSVAWLSDLIATASVTEVAQYHADPGVHPRTGGALDPLSSILGFDGGMMTPGQVYRRQFDTPGVYTYTVNGWGGGRVMVVGAADHRIYLPLVLKNH